MPRKPITKWVSSLDRPVPSRKYRDSHDEISRTNDKILTQSLIHQIYLSNQIIAENKLLWVEKFQDTINKLSNKYTVHTEKNAINNITKIHTFLDSIDLYYYKYCTEYQKYHSDSLDASLNKIINNEFNTKLNIDLETNTDKNIHLLNSYANSLQQNPVLSTELKNMLYQNFEEVDTYDKTKGSDEFSEVRNSGGWKNNIPYDKMNEILRGNTIRLDISRKKRKVHITPEINSIEDLIKVAEENPLDPDIEYNIDISKIHAILEPLRKLNGMIGMMEIKETIVDQLLYYIQGFHLMKELPSATTEPVADPSADTRGDTDNGLSAASGAGAGAGAGDGGGATSTTDISGSTTDVSQPPTDTKNTSNPFSSLTIDPVGFQSNLFAAASGFSGTPLPETTPPLNRQKSSVTSPWNEDTRRSIFSRDAKDILSDKPKSASQNPNEFLHIVLYGPPGTGKTDVAKIIGEIFSRLGVLSGNTFRKATRADMIAEYLGQTAVKTRKLLESCKGGVLFIDEAYALGNNEKKDYFSKECIDTLNECLSDMRSDLMVIVAGYEKDLKECFFSYNPGLESRFVWRYTLPAYKHDELERIYRKKSAESGWRISDEDAPAITRWFERHYDKFPAFGRDMETLFSKVKIAHSRRVFALPPSEHRIITLKDFDAGLRRFLSHQGSRDEEKERERQIMRTLYV
jgi:hypothetical protein